MKLVGYQTMFGLKNLPFKDIDELLKGISWKCHAYTWIWCAWFMSLDWFSGQKVIRQVAWELA